MPSPDKRPRYYIWAISAGLIFALTSLAVAPLLGLEISDKFGNGEGRTTWLDLFVGVFLTGWFFSWLLVTHPQRFSILRGATTGVLVAFFSYPVVLTLADFAQRGWTDTFVLGERIDNIVLVTGLTLVTTGFAATLIGAVVGMAATWLLTRLHPIIAAPTRAPAGLWQRLAGIVATLIVIGLVGAYAWLTLRPIELTGLGKHQTPSTAATSYAEAIAAYDGVRAREAELPIHERCPSTLLTHGAKAARVVIYFHGFTSCPAQGDELAAKLFALGYNVYLPRMYGHGEIDPRTATLSGLTATHLIDLANESVDIAQGLGDEVVVIGLSAGGTIAAWTAQYRPDVDHAIAVSPFFGPYFIPPWATRAAINLTLAVPNLVMWWNPLENIGEHRDEYAFALPATHALAEIMVLGQMVATSAQTTAPKAQAISVLLNEADVAVSNGVTEDVIAAWRSHGTEVKVTVLPFSHHLPHDIINPRERGADTELVYGTLLDMMNGVAH